MRRFLLLFTVLGLVLGSVVTAEAAQKRPKRFERTVQGSYDTQFVPYGGLVTGTCDETHAIGCVTIDVRPAERYFTANVTDAHGQPVLVTAFSRGTATGSGMTYGTFCGKTEEPIRFYPGAGLRFSVGYWDPGLPTAWASCPPGFGTTGTVSVTLSNLP